MQFSQLAISEVWISLILFGILFIYREDINKQIPTKFLLIFSIVRLLVDAVAWGVDGVAGPVFGVIARASSYLSFVLNDEVLSLFVLFLWYTIKKEGEKVDIVIRIYWIITVISILTHTVNLFFNWFYTFDSNNTYSRGPYYHFVYVTSFAAIITNLWMFIRYRKRFSLKQKHLGWTYIVLITGSTFYEFFNYGLALQTYSEIFAAIIAFFIGELEVRENLRKTTEKFEESRKEVEAANQSKTLFLNNMSHDIRTPMNAILGFTKLMYNELDNPEKMKDYLGKIDHSGDYLLSIINNVLEIARIDSGKESEDNVFVALNEPNDSVIPLLEEELKSKKLNFSFSSHIDHIYIMADMAKNKQMTMNLLSNAIKYTPEGGSIHMDFSEVPSDKEGYAAYVTTVSDTGIGMSKEFQKQIFEAFSRERNTTESKIAGTGLGMAIVKKLVDLNGGSIEVESELGKGTTFKVKTYHQIVENPEIYLEKRKEEKKDVDIPKGKRILLAEDNELNAEIAIAILEECGFKVEHAIDGVVCFDMLCKADADYYDLILMDIQMPNLDGYDATKKIRNHEDLAKANIPIIAMTANAFEEDKQKAFKTGMNAFVAKPIVIPDLLSAIESACRK